jgi:Type I phosphodiesterase / nucleotide pyrophosphatase
VSAGHAVKQGERLERLFVCYLPALDLREVAAGAFPFVARLLASCPSVRFRAQPSTDQLVTMLTGTYPAEHGLWGPRLRPDWATRTSVQKLVDRLPDLVTTSVQGLRHLVVGPLDLATMPPRRRRRFDWLRFNLKYSPDLTKTERPINGFATPLTLIGADRSRYVYFDDYWGLDRARGQIGNGDYVLEMVDVHCLDHLQHWQMSDQERMRELCAGIDDFVAALHAKCRQNGLGFVLLSDHGMEPVDRVVDLVAGLRALDVPPVEYDRFVENSKATFWFHTEAARATITAHLMALGDGRLLGYEAMARYGLKFPDNRYGDAYFYARPGATFFPNDFHQPLASLIVTLTDRQQRQRLRTPWHQADHGYLSEADSEAGFMLLAEDGYQAAADEVELIDIAPSLLALLGRSPAATMRGRSVFRRCPCGPASARI